MKVPASFADPTNVNDAVTPTPSSPQSKADDSAERLQPPKSDTAWVLVPLVRRHEDETEVRDGRPGIGHFDDELGECADPDILGGRNLDSRR